MTFLTNQGTFVEAFFKANSKVTVVSPNDGNKAQSELDTCQ